MQELDRGVLLPDNSDMAPIQTWATMMGHSINEALPYRWDNQAAQDAVDTENLLVGTMGYRIDQGNQAYVWTGSTWVAQSLGEPSDFDVGRNLTVGDFGSWGESATPYINLKRRYNGIDRELSTYITAAANTPEVGFMLRVDGVNHSRLVYNNVGEIFINTYAGSPTPTATRYVPFAMATGINSITPVANANTQLTVTFPAGRFTQPPEVVVTPSTTVAGNTVEGWAATAVTTSSFVLNVRRTNTTSTSLRWIAVQMREGNSHG